MLNFRKLKLSDREKIIAAVSKGDTDGSSYSFGTLFAWGDSYSIEIADFDDMILMRGNSVYGRYYVYPSGKGDIKSAVEAMIEDCHNDGHEFRFVLLLENNKKTLEELFPDKFDFVYDRDSSEYVYSVEKMANLPGKKFHGKKGHVNAFFRNHEDVRIDPITQDNIHLCLDIQKKWIDVKTEDTEALEKENLAIEKAVRYYKELDFDGAVLFADGIPVAFTMGEKIKNNTFCTHYEKTIPEYRDAFPVINNGFTKLMLMSYDYVNREEDTGAEGLRKAKLSYYPEFLLDKYSATLKYDPMRKYSVTPDDYDELVSLWQTVFGDEAETVRFFLDKAVSAGEIYAKKIAGKIVSAFYLVDSQLINGNKTEKVRYLYAAATLPGYRKQGIMSEMIKYAAEVLADKGYAAIVLCPADEKLYDYYEKLGFTRSFSDRIYTINSSALDKYKGARYFNCSVSYSDIRHSIPSEAFVEFSSGYLDYARKLSSDYGFEICASFDDEDKVFITGHREEETVFIDEAISADGNYNHVLSVLSDIDCKTIKLKTPECIILEGFDSVTVNSGMMLRVSDDREIRDAYLGVPCM
ncbi:MAG: GNAT family N-acetyltransferase [Clostridia bacterium]|nr:GNAT family N-acetyltransferase [Clostridia bacterium]